MKKMAILLVFVLFTLNFSSFALASSNSDQVSLDTIMKESKGFSGKVLKLVKDGKEDAAANLPEVIIFKKKLEKNPKIANEYFSSLKAVQALRQKDFEATLGANESKIIEFDDGSFIHVSSTTNLDTTANQVSSLSTINPLSIDHHATDDYHYDIWGLYKAASLDLYTTYDYDYYWADITDVNVSASVYVPAWLVSKTGTIVSPTKAKGVFEMQDVLGSFGVTLITTLTPGASYPSVSHSHL